MFRDQPVVFKRFFKLTHGDNNVTAHANASSMASEAYRLVTGQEILAAFYAQATETATRVDRGMLDSILIDITEFAFVTNTI